MSSDSQRPPPQNTLQRRLTSQPPPAADSADGTQEIPDWRSDRFAELAAAEASEYAKPEPGASSTEVIARVGSRAASGAVKGLASASAGTARVAAQGLRSGGRLGLTALRGLLHGALITLDALGGAVISVLRGLALGGLALLRGLGGGLGRGGMSGGAALWARRRSLFTALLALGLAVLAIVGVRSYAARSRRAVAASSTRAHDAIVGVGADLHRVFVDLGLADPIPGAADKPDPPPYVARFLIEVTTTPESALARLGDQERSTPAAFELDALPEGPLRLLIRKPGFEPVARRLNLTDFAEDGPRLRYALHLALRPADAARGSSAEVPPTAEPSARPQAPPPATPAAADTGGPVQLEASDQVPASPF